MKKILVAIDFSEYTAIACEYALEIAKKNKAEIQLIHTFFDRIQSSSSSIPDIYGVNPFINPEINSEIEENAKNQMLNLKNELIAKLENDHHKGVTISTVLTASDFETDLIEYCEDYHPSMVIIGAKGKGQSLNIFGNMANKVINDLRFPVMAVPEIKKYLGIKNIMFATDLHASDDVLIRKTFNLLENFDINLYCVHIVEKNDYLKAYTSMEQLKSVYAKEAQDGKFYCDVLEGEDIKKEIDKFIKTNHIDLIVFLPHKTNFFQRLFGQHFSKKYLFETNLPLLAIRL